jgi:hypothetical protein
MGPSAQELRLGGLRINPATNGPGRPIFNKGFSLMNIDETNLRIVEGLPENPRLGYPIWSGDGKKLAFTVLTAPPAQKNHSTPPQHPTPLRLPPPQTSGIELWICEINTWVSARIAEQNKYYFWNAISWLPDNQSLIYTIADPGRGIMPERSLVPEGPVIQENLGGEVRLLLIRICIKIRLMRLFLNISHAHQAYAMGRKQSVKLGNLQ